MSFLATAWIIARRELAAYFHAPIAYVVGVTFLVLQGFSFYTVVEVLSDPARPAPVGAVLASYFGGTFLFWAVLFATLAALSMRLCAEDRRQGTWETLFTAPVNEGAVLTGKWLGAVAFHALLWLPTLAYPAILAHYSPPGTQLDSGPIAAAYLGVLALGAALLAVGIAASAATQSQIIAAIAAFAASFLLLAVGQLPDLAPDWISGASIAARALGQIDLRGHLDDFARGEITLAALVFLATLTVLGLVAATLAAVWERRRPAERMARILALALLAVIAVSSNVLVVRHGPRWDVTASRIHSLDPRSQTILSAIEPPGIEAWVIRAGLDAFVSVQSSIDRLLERITARQPLLLVHTLDPTLDPGRLEALAIEFAQAPENLRDGGMILLQRGDRRRAVDLFDMAEFEEDQLGVGSLSRSRAEAAIVSAIAELIDLDRPTVCYSTEHGEMLLEPGDAGDTGDTGDTGDSAGRAPTWTSLGQELVRDGAVLQPVDHLAAGPPASCRVLVIAGPRTPFTPDQASSVDSFLARGGRLLLALPELPGPTGGTGLELVLAAHGIALPAAVVVDPGFAVATPAQWLTTTGYGDHPITASFRDRRATLWLAPRAITLAGAPAGHDKPLATVLVESSPDGFAETDLALVRQAKPSPDPGDLAGPVAVAVASDVLASGARLVVLASAYSFATDVTARSPGNQLLAASAIRWLSGQKRDLGIEAKDLENIRLLMTRGQKTAVLVLAAAILPGLLAFLGALVFWRRRRA